MSEFKFSCPHCGQHIQCDISYSGAQINCPSCQKSIVVPQAPRMVTPPPPVQPLPSPGLSTRQSTGAPSLTGAPPPRPKSNTLVKVLVGLAVGLVCAGLSFTGVTWLFKHHAEVAAEKGNPAAQVQTPTANAAVQALSILMKVHSAYTNLASVTEDSTITLSLDLSKLTLAEVDPNAPANARNAHRRPPGMPRTFTLTADISARRAQTNWFYLAGDAVIKADRQISTNTFAFWSAGKGTFLFADSHQRRARPTYVEFPATTAAGGSPEQARNLQRLFEDPAQLAKILKHLGQTADETVNGHDCDTLTARVLGQKVKIWADKSTYLIVQSQITLGGAVNDADIDDALSLFVAGFTNLPPQQWEGVKARLKQFTPAIAKIRGTFTSTAKAIDTNPTLTADDFAYPVPPGVRLFRMPGAATPPATRTSVSLADIQRNECINNLRQIDGAKNEWALENGKPKGTPVTAADIAPYIRGGVLPKCPAGGTYTIGKVGEPPTCSVPGHALP